MKAITKIKIDLTTEERATLLEAQRVVHDIADLLDNHFAFDSYDRNIKDILDICDKGVEPVEE